MAIVKSNSGAVKSTGTTAGGSGGGKKSTGSAGTAAKKSVGTAAQKTIRTSKAGAPAASSGGSSRSSSGSSESVGYVKYTGGNAQLDEQLSGLGKTYSEARAKALAGDAAAVAQMQNANDRANQLRNQYGYAAERADDDISYVRGQLKELSASGGAGLGSVGNAKGPEGGSASSQFSETLLEQAQAPAQEAQDYSEYIRQLQQAAQDKALAELKAAYEKNMTAIEAARGQVEPQYAQARNQAAGQAAVSQRAWQEQAAALGLNAGAAGQAALAQTVALQNDLNDLGRAENADLASLELQRTQTTADYNEAIAQARSSGDYELAQALYAEKVRVDEANRQAQAQRFQQMLQAMQFDHSVEQDALAQENREKSRQDELAQQAWENRYQEQQAASQAAAQEETQYNRLWDLATAMAEYGDFSGFSDLGLTDAQIANMRSVWQQDRDLALRQAQASLEKSSGGAGGSGRSGSGGSGASGSGGMTFSTAKSLAKSGYFDDDVLRVLRSNGYSDEAIQAQFGWEGNGPVSYETLSPAAKSIADSYRHINPSTGANIPAVFAGRIEQALRSRSITQREADYLTSLLD